MVVSWVFKCPGLWVFDKANDVAFIRPPFQTETSCRSATVSAHIASSKRRNPRSKAPAFMHNSINGTERSYRYVDLDEAFDLSNSYSSGVRSRRELPNNTCKRRINSFLRLVRP